MNIGRKVKAVCVCKVRVGLPSTGGNTFVVAVENVIEDANLDPYIAEEECCSKQV